MQRDCALWAPDQRDLHGPGAQTTPLSRPQRILCGNPAPLRPLSSPHPQARGRARADQSVYSFVATQGSRELRREQTNEALEVLMERAVAAVQGMDRAEYQAKVCGQSVHPGAGGLWAFCLEGLRGKHIHTLVPPSWWGAKLAPLVTV